MIRDAETNPDAAGEGGNASLEAVRDGAETGFSTPVTVVGDERVSLTHDVVRTLPAAERTVTTACASGVRHTSTWAGVPVDALLSLADAPGETTHVLVESTDGYRRCLDVATALDGLLAFVRDGTPIADRASFETRFVAPGTDGAETVKAVATLEARHLDAGTDPESFERRG